MNEKQITVGMDKDGQGYYAFFSNTHVIYSGKTGLEALQNLFASDAPIVQEHVSWLMPQKSKPEGNTDAFASARIK